MKESGKEKEKEKGIKCFGSGRKGRKRETKMIKGGITINIRLLVKIKKKV